VVRFIGNFKGFLRLRTGLRRIRWVAQFGGVPQVALAADGCVGRLKVKIMVKSRRLRRASATGVGAGSGCLLAVAACGRVCPGSLVAVVA